MDVVVRGRGLVCGNVFVKESAWERAARKESEFWAEEPVYVKGVGQKKGFPCSLTQKGAV